MNSLIKKGNIKNSIQINKFEKYNLTENPFPSTPFVNQENSDKRYNGEIYEEEIRANEFRLIEENFLKVEQSDLNHTRIGYIQDTSYVGRGNGKSTFALNLQKKINKNYCLDISNEANKCFGLYIVPEPSGRTRTFIHFLDLIVSAIDHQNILDYSLAAIRLDAIIELKLDIFSDNELKDEEQLIKNLNNLAWFDSQKICLSELHHHFSERIEFNLLSQDNPLRKNRGYNGSTNLSIVKSKDIIDHYYSLRKDSEKINFIFNDLVNIFILAGFNGSYIIVDDFERIPDFQSDRQKRDFAFELRTSFFDGSSKNAKIGFFNLIMMLHAGVPRLVQKAWGDSGMDQRSPILSVSSTQNHIISFDKLNKSSVYLLIKKYLSEFRIQQQSDINPFTDDAVSKIGEYCEYNAAKILKLSNDLIEYAASKEISKIDRDVINEMLQITQIETEAKPSLIEENSEDLLSKIDKK